jgi:hypothetical protein
MEATLGIAAHDHRLGADGAGDVVARLRDLGLVTDVDPAAIPDPIQLLGEDGRVREQALGERPVFNQPPVVDN